MTQEAVESTRYIQKSVVVGVDETTVDSISDARELVSAPVDARVTTMAGFQFVVDNSSEPVYFANAVNFTWVESI